MTLTRTTLLRIIKIAVGLILAGLIIAYAIWGSLNYARGPVIDIISPANESAVDSTTVVIKGRVDRVNDVSLNGDPLSIDQQGNFIETVIIFPGMNELTFTAHDQFNRTTVKELDLVGTAQFPVPNVKKGGTIQATSTATST